MSVTHSSSLADYWYCAGPCPRPFRKPIRRIVEGEPLVIFPDGDRKPHALIDRCAHRGMALSRGRVVSDCVQCPYHGWEFDGAGELCRIPALPPEEQLPVLAPLRSYPIVEFQQHFWVWMGAASPTNGVASFPYYDDPRWGTTFLWTEAQAPVEACLENFLDVPHKMTVHAGLLQRSEHQPVRALVQTTSSSAEVELFENPSDVWIMKLLFGRTAPMRHKRRFILPATTQIELSFGHSTFIVTSHFTQSTPSSTTITCAISWRTPFPKVLVRPFFRAFFRRALRQDLAILKVQGEQLERFGPSMVLSPTDLLARHVRALRRSARAPAAELAPSAAAQSEVVLVT